MFFPIWKPASTPQNSHPYADFTERVVQDFLRYQMTTYPFADGALSDRDRLAALLSRLARLLTTREHMEAIRSGFSLP